MLKLFVQIKFSTFTTWMKLRFFKTLPQLHICHHSTLEVLWGFRDSNITIHVLLLKEFRLDPDGAWQTIFIFDTLFPYGHDTRVLDMKAYPVFSAACHTLYYAREFINSYTKILKIRENAALKLYKKKVPYKLNLR